MGDTVENQKSFNLTYIKSSAYIKIINSKISNISKINLLSIINRINSLFMISRAGSGHIGTSFSSMEIYTILYTFFDNKKFLFFSSKGHDSPAVYANLYIKKIISEKQFFNFRRLNGLPGHPDIKTKGIIFNTGSLGMGVSKAKGLVLANRLNKINQKIIVILGDGELQEGQFWESLFGVINHKMIELTLIIDHNKIQSDNFISEVSDLGNLKKKFLAFGFNFININGHNANQIINAIKIKSKKPKIILANTIKGKGVKIFESKNMSKKDDYIYHSGAPSDQIYNHALESLVHQLKNYKKIDIKKYINKYNNKINVSENTKFKYSIVDIYSHLLVKLAKKNKNILVLDADLYKDTGVKKFKEIYSNRFFEFGIAEQDMVSTASGFAAQNFLPFCHSFSCFLSTRPNEQIYNNCSENRKIIYIGALSGVIPAGPGHSHQSVREISSLGAIPNLIIFEPSYKNDLKVILSLAINSKVKESIFIRMSSVKIDENLNNEIENNINIGNGYEIIKSKNIAVVTYGPTNLQNSYKAIRKKEYGLINMPWLNYIDKKWLISISKRYDKLLLLESQYGKFSLNSLFSQRVKEYNLNIKIFSIALDDFPPSGQENETLRYLKMDHLSIKKKLKQIEYKN